MAISDLIKSASVMSGGLSSVKKNTPSQYTDRQKQYFADETVAFTQQTAKYAGNYVKAQVQGLDPTDFYKWTTQLIRMADVYTPATQKIIDDTKQVLFANPAIDYIPRGAKIVTMGSTWLVTNPQNISSVVANTVVEKCNAVWRHLDWYGNILSEPISIQKSLMSASSNDKQEFVLITDGYFDFKAQLNEYTNELSQNSRIILGSGAYALRGVTDFIQEFTGDDTSVHMIEFTGQYTQPNKTDDMVNKIAGGLMFSWLITIKGKASLTIGTSAQFEAISLRNDEWVDIQSAHSISYLWASSDPAIATVSATGLVTASGEGRATITAILEQNPSKSTEFIVSVTATQDYVAFTATPPTSINIYDNATLMAAYYENGVQTADIVTWSFLGAPTVAYSATVDGNRVTISSWGASGIPLTVTATCNGESVSAEIELAGL